MQTTIYQNQNYLLIRKPHGVPSTFGEQESFLDIIKNNMSEKRLVWTPLSQLVPEDIFSFVTSRLEDFEERTNEMEEWNGGMDQLLRQQVETFGEDQEFGLLNRLDNDTAWFLYFAKNKKAFDEFKVLQRSDGVKKYYLAQVAWRLINSGWTVDKRFAINSSEI